MKEIRCAIYTRKSSEEGLEQSFNSLDAQREACEAYVLSQKHEGWQALSAKYDDGGFSGGNMERPGLKRLLEDISAGKINTVVVYKVDRLTRSLGDFARIVESFDGKGVSFVSVTQQFNTTTSMGRLTLNVLLSFAQFEREVTGERIRDKVAASKKKGMWMGGVVPLGYDLKDHQLIINETEAQQVREIFKQYLRLGSVFDLQVHLKEVGVRSKRRQGPGGKAYGGMVLSRGTLYHLLNNPLYIGKISHKGQSYPGQHAAIITLDIWTQATDMLKGNRVRRITSSNLPSGRMLTGLLFDEEGNRFTPSHASKKGRRYDYYICQSVQGYQRLPAIEIERLVATTVRSLLLNSLELSKHFAGLAVRDMRLLVAAAQHAAEHLSEPGSADARRVLKACLHQAAVTDSQLNIELGRNALGQELLGKPTNSVSDDAAIALMVPFQLKRRGSQVRLVLAHSSLEEPEPTPSLIRSVALARDWADQIISGKARTLNDLSGTSGMSRHYVRRILRCAVLSPAGVDSIIQGRHAIDLTVVGLTDRLSMDWGTQQSLIVTS